MAKLIYILCASTSIVCALMLLRGYLRSRARLLLWCSLCFCALAVNNALLFIDLVVYPAQELIFLGLQCATWRGITAVCGLALLVFGLVWDSAPPQPRRTGPGGAPRAAHAPRSRSEVK